LPTELFYNTQTPPFPLKSRNASSEIYRPWLTWTIPLRSPSPPSLVHCFAPTRTHCAPCSMAPRTADSTSMRWTNPATAACFARLTRIIRAILWPSASCERRVWWTERSHNRWRRRRSRTLSPPLCFPLISPVSPPTGRSISPTQARHRICSSSPVFTFPRFSFSCCFLFCKSPQRDVSVRIVVDFDFHRYRRTIHIRPWIAASRARASSTGFFFGSEGGGSRYCCRGCFFAFSSPTRRVSSMNVSTS
jgi:hypothetical protein